MASRASGPCRNFRPHNTPANSPTSGAPGKSMASLAVSHQAVRSWICAQPCPPGAVWQLTRQEPKTGGQLFHALAISPFFPNTPMLSAESRLASPTPPESIFSLCGDDAAMPRRHRDAHLVFGSYKPEAKAEKKKRLRFTNGLLKSRLFSFLSRLDLCHHAKRPIRVMPNGLDFVLDEWNEWDRGRRLTF